VAFDLIFTERSSADLDSLEADSGLAKRLKALRKALAYLESNPRHPGLNTHKYDPIKGPANEEVSEAYAENKTPAAWRIFCHYGPGRKSITILAILRLPTNRSVTGDETHTPDGAWLSWQKPVLDERCSLLPLEPAELAAEWRKKITGRDATPKPWIDAYLAAWAHAAGLALATFDTGFRNYQPRNLQLLKPE